LSFSKAVDKQQKNEAVNLGVLVFRYTFQQSCFNYAMVFS